MGLKTVTGAVPTVAMSPARICAVSCVLLPKVVVRGLPFQRTTDELLKFVPVTVSANAQGFSASVQALGIQVTTLARV